MNNVDSNTINLSAATKLFQGTERDCYLHPHDPAKCIKVARLKGGRQHYRERRYFRRLALRKIPWRHLPTYYGVVETDRGEGLVFSLVTDFDGAVSARLKNYVEANGPERVLKAIEDLKNHFLTWGIITCDMNLDNFMVRRTSPDDIEIVMIDGLGNREFIPVSSFCLALARRKMRRRWKRLDGKLARELPGLAAAKKRS